MFTTIYITLLQLRITLQYDKQHTCENVFNYYYTRNYQQTITQVILLFNFAKR